MRTCIKRTAAVSSYSVATTELVQHTLRLGLCSRLGRKQILSCLANEDRTELIEEPQFGSSRAERKPNAVASGLNCFYNFLQSFALP
jgi:hypothetical protein